ncbi:hypothetical protein DFQ26_004394 [Actinomortierella ambigua]|nr:hypothetical protein DFQ26_004394 [Actinomortierella ambigua]
MYGRRSDADCILNVGEQRFYVHVQMLAARSPTFRCIFDDMIAHNAWQAASPTTPHSRGSEAGANGLNSVRPQSAQFLPCDEEQAGQCSPHGEGMQEGLLRSTNHPERLDPLVKSALTPDMILAIQQLQYAAMSLGTSNNTPHRSLPRSNAIESLQQCSSTAKRPKEDCEGLMVSESDDEGMGSDHRDEDSIESGNSDGEDGDEEMNDDGLPELRLDLADPEGSRFEELLYWLYTDDHERWLAAFTPSNYRSILANILTLNIANSEVLELCRRFEQQHPAESSIHGLADSQLRPFPPS